MTNATGFAPRAVLADRLRTHGLATDAALVAGGALFTAAMAQLEVPMWPVPITGQTLAVVLVGATLGARRGMLSLLVYAVAGLAGAPFFADMQGGLQALALPSFGYVIGFIPAAGLVGWLARRNWDRHVGRAAVAMLLASAIPFVTGLPYLAVALGQLGAPNDVQSVLAAGLYPFIVGGIAKALIAAGILPLAWKAVGRR
ncbi:MULTISPECIES: biotin transporter BioY [Curtobacterium]|jgi:biotin transport system substrate-specific component|uniref:biotin transporter BioY n=1 Tax=Curtobacterium TaxID=2034 RepID=UPI000DA77096|nr:MULTISPECIES: biotin transporter BioY [Curtobacterium]MDO3696261.1 biotin transporter BioY [Curtobacterium flaccumfaciens]MBO9040160.1 biotin transporter BioY [Curtobacterium flaccumfaciens pv. flaccumfaciens]PZE31833.1 biotin transporter BioY [Curtobacterium sp. MCLR17_042]PZF43082.1 biotin transporter BioY [Curtobacterium sp. MCLR17_053]PZF51067.1 biotin transporter BioY [Curtobacterium sp. MCLR17_051]